MKKITRKTLLQKSKVEYADFSINHVEGCSHGCLFPCYAMIMKKRFGIIKNYKDWLQPKIVSNALELLDEEIPKKKKDIKSVYLSFSTDPFMYQQEEVCDLSLEIIERLNIDNIKSICLTKGIYPKQLAKKEIYGAKNEYGITLVSLSEDFRKKFEPGAAPIKDRIKSLEFLHDAGLKTWFSMEPYPTPNIFKQDLNEILKELTFVDKIIFGKWNYNGAINSAKNHKAFYNDAAEKIILFCEKNNIDFIIKKGAITEIE